MAGPKLTLIVNPNASRGRAASRTPALVAALQGAGREVTIQFTRSLEHGGEIARDAVASGCVAVAAGGDGLVSEVANAVAEQPDAVMGIIPLGRGNDFARALGIKSVDTALAVLERNVVKPVDLGRIGDRYFTCIASVGFDSRVQEIAENAHFLSGSTVYAYATVRALLGWKSQQFTIESDGEKRNVRGYSVGVANGGYFGGGMKLAPDASLTDGEFDVVTIEDVSKPVFMWVGIRVFWGGHITHPVVKISRARTVALGAPAGFTIFADGEPVGPAPLTAEVRAGALSVLV